MPRPSKNLSVIFPASFRNLVAPEVIASRPYVMSHLATHTETGEQHWLIESDTQSGINQFKGDYSNVAFEQRQNHNHKGERSKWFQNAFSDFDDGVSDPVTILTRGHNHLERIDAARAHARSEISQRNKDKSKEQ